MKTLTHIQSKVYDYICSYVAQHGSAPTLREISAQIKTRGTASAICHLKALEKKGYIDRRNGAARGIAILNKQSLLSATAENSETSVPIPLVGTVRAGHPVPPIEDIEDFLKTDPFWLRGDDCFFLRVRGDSMTEDHIIDGDLALIRPQTAAENGEIVVAMVNDEATLKEFHREKDHIRLQPKNPNMQPIIIHPGDGEVSIIGKVVGVFRRLR